MELSASSSQQQRRGIVKTPLGHFHYRSTGNLDAGGDVLPIVAFHMSPRSSDEYVDAMPIISSTSNGERLVVAIDEPGYGGSQNPCKSCTLEEIADCMLSVIDQLNISSFIVAGSLMGCYFALSLASKYPDRVRGVICTNLYSYSKEKKEEALKTAANKDSAGEQQQPIPDPWVIKDDGSHLTELFNQRASFLDPLLNTRVVSDQLQYLLNRRERYAQGINIEDAVLFDVEAAASKITCPVLCIQGEGATAFFDAIGFDMTGRFAEAKTYFGNNCPKFEVETIANPGSINLINQNAKEWAKVALDFVERLGLK